MQTSIIYKAIFAAVALAALGTLDYMGQAKVAGPGYTVSAWAGDLPGRAGMSGKDVPENAVAALEPAAPLPTPGIEDRAPERSAPVADCAVRGGSKRCTVASGSAGTAD